MKILKKGTLTIVSREDAKVSGYDFDCEGESMLSVSIAILEEGVRDLQAQIDKARAEGLEITDGGGNNLNGEKWEFPFGIKAHPVGTIAPDVRWFDNYFGDGPVTFKHIPINPPSDPAAPFFKLILRQAIYFLLLMLVVGVGLAVFL